MLTALASGVLLGLSAGLAPGPMLALVLSHALRHGAREGCKVALTPLATDTPIILVAMVLASKAAELRPALGCISIAGAAFVLFLAWEGFGPVRVVPGASQDRPRSWLKGVVTNLLNPHPWVFWLTVGAAILARAMAEGWMVAAAFLFGFYLMLVGSKLLIALLVGRFRHLLEGRPYRVAMRTLSVLLAGFAVLLLREGLRQLGVLRAG